MILVGKATPNPHTGEIEYYLSNFERMLSEEGQFVFAWDFNPNPMAITTLRANMPGLWLYLAGHQRRSPMRMRIIDFYHDPSNVGIPCPAVWLQYCIVDLNGVSSFLSRNNNPKQIHIWFLIDSIQHLEPPVNLSDFEPLFPSGKYGTWGRNNFAFLR